MPLEGGLTLAIPPPPPPPTRLVHEEVAHRKPGGILKSLGKLETEVQQGMKELEGCLHDSM
jgi:hypothetical protein